MSTDTHDLIDKLARDLKPVRPLPSAAVRAAILAAWSLAIGIAVLFLVHPPRADLVGAVHQRVYLVQGLAMLAAGVLSAFAAFRLSVPDTRLRAPVSVALGLSTALWLAMIIAEAVAGGDRLPARSDSCLIGLVMAMGIPLIMAIAMVTRGAPVRRGWAGYAAVLSVGSLAALVMRFMCPDDSHAHLLFLHFLPVLALAVLGAPFGRILLKDRIAKKFV